MPKILDTLVLGSKFGLNNSRLVKNIPAMLARDVMWNNVEANILPFLLVSQASPEFFNGKTAEITQK